MSQDKDRYRMPTVEVGDLINWYAEGDKSRAPYPAIVTAVAFQSLNISIFQADTYNVRCQDGVRHVSDKSAQPAEVRECGVWDFTNRHKKLLSLERQLQEFLAEQSRKKGA